MINDSYAILSNTEILKCGILGEISKQGTQDYFNRGETLMLKTGAKITKQSNFQFLLYGYSYDNKDIQCYLNRL